MPSQVHGPFTNIRSDDARENYSAKVSLPGDEKLKQIDDNTVAVVDPTPNDKPSDEALPAPALSGTAAAQQARDASGITTPDPDPDAATAVAAATDQAGTQQPAGVPKDQIEQPQTPSDDQVAALAGRAPNGLPSDEPTKSEAVPTLDLAAEAQKTREVAQQSATKDLNASKEFAAESTENTNDNNEVAAADQEVIVAKVTAPTSVDAAGKPVDTSLSAEGDVITMHVDHQGKDVSYPIAADPEYEIVYTRWNLGWFPELVQETYISRWTAGSRYIGNWHPVYCAWGWVTSCSGTGVPAWYNGYAGGAHHVAYWPSYNWGPVWQTYYTPVYATRWVVARWIPYWAPDVSSAALMTIIESGGDEVYEPGNEDDGDVGDDVYFVRAAARIRPACRRINRAVTALGYGSGNLKFRYCWNRKKKKVSLDSQYDNEVQARTSTLGKFLGLGSIKVDDEDFSPRVLTLDGAYRGALDGHGHFRFKGEVSLGPFVSPEVTLRNVDWGVVARYNGSWCPYYKDRRQQSCGV